MYSNSYYGRGLLQRLDGSFLALLGDSAFVCCTQHCKVRRCSLVSLDPARCRTNPAVLQFFFC